MISTNKWRDNGRWTAGGADKLNREMLNRVFTGLLKVPIIHMEVMGEDNMKVISTDQEQQEIAEVDTKITLILLVHFLEVDSFEKCISQMIFQFPIDIFIIIVFPFFKIL